MQNSIPKLRQRSIIFKKPGFLSEKLKALTTSNYHFLLKFCTRFLMFTKGCSGFFILFSSWVINKNVKNECAETRYF